MRSDDALCAQMRRWLAKPPPQACHLDKLGAGSEQGRRDKAPPEPYWPYPWPEEEMVARYGLRRLTEIEAKVFPGIPLALRVAMVAAESSPGVLYDFLAVMDSSDARTPKGLRASHPGNALAQAANNRLAQLDAPSYRQFQLQQSVRQPAWPNAAGAPAPGNGAARPAPAVPVASSQAHAGLSRRPATHPGGRRAGVPGPDRCRFQLRPGA